LTTADTPGSKGTLPDLLAAQARERPDALAAVHGQQPLTFRALHEGSRAVARALARLGVAADDCVGLLIEPSLDLLVAVWGVAGSGGAYLPLAPEYPEERLRSMLGSSGARVVVTQEHLRDRARALVTAGTTVVTVREARALGERDQVEPPGPSPRDLAYVIYTSGSTGTPKGVMIEHRSIVNQLRWLRDVQGIDERRRVVQKTPISFDAAQWEILAPACGSTVVVGAPGLYRDPVRLAETIVEQRATTLQCVPTLLKALLENEDFARARCLEQVFSGGEPLSRTVARRFFEVLPACELVNLYGPTECTINTSAFRVDPAWLADAPDVVPIGLPVTGMRYLVLGPDLEPLGPGEVGELHVGGVQVARGYRNRPDLTGRHFVPDPFAGGGGDNRLYRTGDLVSASPDGTVHFVGRVDSQVKLRGYRVELDEIRLAIEAHDWVKDAAVVVRDDAATGFQRLVAFVELSPREAALMDQGRGEAHHRSKERRFQIRAQLSGGGCRTAAELDGRKVVPLPGRTPTGEQRRRVFARKTYRFFEGPDVTVPDLLEVLGARPAAAAPRPLGALQVEELGQLLRMFGQFHSPERLLPKYGYASPGALYATQLYAELAGVARLPAGSYYYHPADHTLVRVGPAPEGDEPRMRVHLVGRRRAIAHVYRTNVWEVLQLEAGHMVGLLEDVLGEVGLGVEPAAYAPAVTEHLDVAGDDCYLGTFAVVPAGVARWDAAVDVYLQAHPGRVPDLAAGLYHYDAGRLDRVSDDLVLRRHVVAINQEVYGRASLGVALVGRAAEPWRRYTELGRALHRLQVNDRNLGFMSSGYSSESGDDLPAARRIDELLRAAGRPTGASYFCVGGRVSDEQVASTGMKEDAVHMRGPTEMIRDDLARTLPDHMLPNKVVVVDALPRTANGKIDARALQTQALPGGDERPMVPPRSATEHRVAAVWGGLLGRDTCSVLEDFFEAGGNSLIAVALVSRLNTELRCGLPQQVLFEHPTIEQLARCIDAGGRAPVASRLVALGGGDDGAPLYLWPGLGGSTMSLRELASRVKPDGPVLGVQAHGLNDHEVPYADIAQIAAEDVRLLRHHQPYGPYRLWGYSFGARIAFEVARALEEAGERVEHLVLVAPGSPRVEGATSTGRRARPSYDDEVYLAVLLSVFAGRIDRALVRACRAVVSDDATFVAFVRERYPQLDPALVARIVTVVRETYGSDRAPVARGTSPAPLRAPVTVLRARGDEPSFVEQRDDFPVAHVRFVDLGADHYATLRDPHVDELVATLRRLVPLD
jgi:amino acid adenylation domain-containing protein